MIPSIVTRAFPAPASPTADLYFMNACADLLGRGVTRLAPTVFASATACLVMRHALGAGPLPPGRRLVYFLDDLPGAGATDPTLPFSYRQKLRLLEGAALSQFAPRAKLVVSSVALGHALGGAAHVMDPYWSEPVACQAHFDPLCAGTGPVDIAFLGSSVHRGGLAFLAPVIAQILAAEPRARFHLAERHRLPAALSGHPRVRRIPGRGWCAYRRGLAARRFHIALYPLAQTPFNMARSRNKLIEHGIVGAAPVYSAAWAPAGLAANAGAGLTLANCPVAWTDAILRLIADPAGARTLAERAGRLAGRLNDPAPQRALWSGLLGLSRDEVANAAAA